MQESDAPATPGGNGGGGNNSYNSAPQFIANNIRVEEAIGRGGMGTVYRATHLSLDRVVAVKIVNQEVAANADITQRFAREARLMAKLRHPRAAMIYDSGTLPDGRLFIVMEFVEGVTLADVLKKEGKLSVQKAVEIATSVCDVLSEAHSLGIIHRDLKPANIMLNGQGVFVLDFGIAKMLNSDNAESLKLSMTGGGALIGTPYYMSPEQCLGNPVEARSDLYSLGALLFEMLSGRPPFDEEIFSALIIKHAMVEAPKLEEIAPDVPPAVAAVVNKLLAKKPEDRPENAAATRAMLQASLSGQAAPTNVYAASPQTPTNPLTQSNLAPAALTQQLPEQNITNAQISQPATETPPAAAASGEKRSSRGIAVAAGVAGLFLLAAAASIGAYLWMKAPSNDTAAAVTNTHSSHQSNKKNSNTYSTPMDKMDHNSMSMDEDYALKPTDEKSNSPSVPLLSSEEADKVILGITQTTEHHADGMQIIKTPKDSALVCLHNKVAEGKTHMFAVERPNVNSPWEISARTALDTPEFHGANWIFEPQDVDGDGFEEVIFKGVNAEGTAHRFMIYVPRTRQNYTALVANNQTTLSPNAQVPNGAAFRKALEKIVKGK